MAATATFSNSLTNIQVQNSLLSYNGSKTFLKKLIPTTVGMILHHRTNLDRKSFQSRNIKGLKFTTFKNVITNACVKEVCRWCAGAVDAFKREYLRELHLLFLSVNNYNEILESYKFEFQYGNKAESSESISSEVLRNVLGEMFDSILNIKVEPLKENQFLPYLCIFYNENVSPNYEPPYYASINNASQLVTRLADICKDYIALGQVNTGFHVINYHCYLPRFNSIMELPNREIIEGERQDVQVVELPESMVIESARRPSEVNTSIRVVPSDGDIVTIDLTENDYVPEQEVCNANNANENKAVCFETGNNGIKCLCMLDKEVFNIDLIECCDCHFMQHVPCAGYLFLHDVSRPYKCNFCKTVTQHYQTHLAACLRLLVAQTFFSAAFSDLVFEQMSDDVQLYLTKNLQMFDVIKNIDGKFVITDKLKSFMYKLFASEDINLEELFTEPILI